MHRIDKYSQHSSIIWLVWLKGWVFVYEVSYCGFKCCCRHLPSDFATDSSKEFLDIQVTIVCVLNLKCVCDMIRTYSQMHRTDKYWQHSSFIRSLWLNAWAFVYELRDCGLQWRCSEFNFTFPPWSEEKGRWHLGNYRVCVHCEMGTLNDKNIQSNAPCR